MAGYEEFLTPDLALPVIDRRMRAITAEAYDNQIVMQVHTALGNEENAAAFSDKIDVCEIALAVLVAERSRWEVPADADNG